MIRKVVLGALRVGVESMTAMVSPRRTSTADNETDWVGGGRAQPRALRVESLRGPVLIGAASLRGFPESFVDRSEEGFAGKWLRQIGRAAGVQRALSILGQRVRGRRDDR